MKFYRYVLKKYASIHDDGFYSNLNIPDFGNSKLELEEYSLVKETPKGYWIGMYFNLYYGEPFWKKWIPKESKKRFAYPTEEEALENYIKRTEKRMKILNGQIWDCKRGLELAEKLKQKNENKK